MKNKNTELGAIGEQIAREYLEKNRYPIIYNNYKTGVYEIDIIVRDSFAVRFIEVKTRREFSKESISDSLDSKKLNSLKKGILGFLSTHHDLNGLEVYLDLIIIILYDDNTHTLEYIQDFHRF